MSRELLSCPSPFLGFHFCRLKLVVCFCYCCRRLRRRTTTRELRRVTYLQSTVRQAGVSARSLRHSASHGRIPHALSPQPHSPTSRPRIVRAHFQRVSFSTLSILIHASASPNVGDIIARSAPSSRTTVNKGVNTTRSPAMAIDAAQQLALAASLAPKRISYTFPPTSPWHSLPRLELPNAPGAGRRTERAGRGSSNPIVNLHPQQPSISAAGRSTPSQHPRHALPVTSMAIDTSTVVLESLDGNTDTSTPRPSGILYTAARDGLVASWELNIQMKKKRPPSLRYSACTQLDNDGDGGDDGDGDGNKRSSSESGEESSLRQRSPEDGATFSQGCATPKGWAKLPVERQWEVDEAWTSPPLQGKPVSRFRSCVQSHTDWINDMLLCNFNMTGESSRDVLAIRLTPPTPCLLSSSPQWSRRPPTDLSACGIPMSLLPASLPIFWDRTQITSRHYVVHPSAAPPGWLQAVSIRSCGFGI